MRRFSFVGTLLVALTLVVGMSWLGLRLIGRSFVPDGVTEGRIEGLQAEATITRDQNGVAYLDAASENDAMAALGYVHAQDRLWQMDLMRRAGEGRLSEVFGRGTIEYDELLRTIGFKRTAQEILRAMPKRTRAALDAYCRGVNAYIDDHRGKYPMEFDALGYEPEQWKPEHSVMICRLLAWELNTAFWTDIVFGSIRGRVDSARFSQILPYYPSDGPTLIPGGQHPEPLLEALAQPAPDTTVADSSAIDSAATMPGDTLKGNAARRNAAQAAPANSRPVPARGGTQRGNTPRTPAVGTPASPARRTPTRPANNHIAPVQAAPNRLATLQGMADPFGQLAELIPVERAMRAFIGINGAHIGSNAWAIAGSRTATGKPMLANDPHLTHTAPCRWFQVVMNYAGNRVAGVTLPGMPFVIIGRNNDVAWGLTSLMADETDFYIEQLDSARRTTMLVDGRWEKLRMIRDTIAVKDSAGVPIVIRIGRHGPLISDIHPYARHTVAGGARLVDSASFLFRTAVAMRWRGADVSQELAAAQGMNNAHNLQQFTAAARLGGIPSLSYVYADRAGTIACIPVARLPQRDAGNADLPFDGTDSRHDWHGTVPPERLPTLVNPERGYIASANNKVTNAPGLEFGDLWEDPSRAMRLEELLADGNNYSLTDFVQMQGDVISPQMLYMKEFLIRAFPDSAKQGAKVRAALTRMRKWNGAMSADAPEAAIAAQWFQLVLEMTYRDELGPDLFRNYVAMAQQPIRAMRYHAMIDSRWFDDITTPGKIETRDDILRNAFGRALTALNKRFESWDIDAWHYGQMHTLTFKHPFEKNETLRSMVNIGPFEIGGANTTLNNGEWDFNEPFSVRVGPSMRQIVDFADTSAFLRSVITSGASGQPLNPYYSNQTVLWMSNGYLTLTSTSPRGTAATSVTRLSAK